MSDGVLVFISLLTAIYAPNSPKIFCIEEPEKHIHPCLLRFLFDKLTDLAYNTSNPVQILVSTHSPYLLNYFKDRTDEVVIVEKNKATTRFIPLKEHEYLLQEKKDGFTLGDLWFSGLIGGVPKTY